MLPAIRIAAAAFMAAAFFSSCAESSRKPGPDPAPVFPYKGTLREAKPSAPSLFPLRGEYRPRALSRADGGFLGWDRASESLRLMDGSGKEKKSWPLEAAFVWTDGELVLARGALFSEGAEKGFSFSLFRLGGGEDPRLLAKAVLDCFPADVLFAAPDSVYVAGADRGDEEHAVFELRAGNPARRLLAAPKKSDFLRLIRSGGDILAFASAREKRERAIEFYFLVAGSSEFRKMELENRPEGALCAYGYGFAFQNAFAVPFAMADGDLAILRIEKSGSGLRVGSVAPGAKGCYLPIGRDPAGGGFWYLAHDALVDPEAYFLGRYDGSGVSLEKVE